MANDVNDKDKKKKGESESAPGTGGACETNTGEGGGDGTRKPECPDGYSDEQPDPKQVEEKQPPKKRGG